MRRLLVFTVALAISSSGVAQVAEPPRPQTVEILSGGVRVKGFLWRPAGRGPFPAAVFNHGRSDTSRQHILELGQTLEQAAQILGPVFVRHGFVFLYPFRRGEGPSADQGQFIGDLLQREEAAKGLEARRQLQLVLMTTDHLQDALAALSFLKNLPYVDKRRVAVAGHSFGGQLTLLEAAHDRTVRAAVTFGAAAGSWDGSPELRDRLIEAVRELTIPVMLIQAANDYSLSPSSAIDGELSRLSKPHVRKIYPAFGDTPKYGHNFFYFDVARWERDVFAFLEANVTPQK
ncbi:MAG TPA: dienelactone hydrolase family protein [Vicinamibacterales bacterium]|jgi:dienelactone hydrolase|nr:dienelactone hydrolase family protein [Vicinamibacterales bacterium]